MSGGSMLLAMLLAIGAGAMKIAEDKAGANPAQKVLKMLVDLEGEVRREGEVEDKQFTRYLDFCRNEKQAKTYSITKSGERIATLSASVTELGAKATELDEAIEGLTAKIANLTQELADKQAARDAEHAEYTQQWTDMENSIKALYRAIKELEEKKGNLKGTVDQALPQVASKIVQSVARYSFVGLSEQHMDDLMSLANPKAPKGGEVADYTYKSGSVVKLLKDLRGTFKENRYNLEMEEMSSSAVFEKQKQSLEFEIKLSEQDKAEKTVSSSKKKAKKEENQQDQDSEEEAKTADEAFLAELDADCDAKEKLYQQRSGERTKELKALGEAVTLLKKGVPPTLIETKKSGLSFLQLRRSEESSTKPKTKQVLSLLSKAAEQYGLDKFNVIALKVKARQGRDEDPFASVKTMIQGVLDDLAAADTEDVAAKKTCDDEAAQLTEKGVRLRSTLRDLKTESEALTSEDNQLYERDLTLSKEIAENKAALKDATKIRSQEKEQNAVALAEAKEGKEACNFAINALATFYNIAPPPPSLLQKEKKDDPAADSSGKTLADKAPKFTIDEVDYTGSSNSNVVIEAIQGLLQDFTDDVQQIETDESEAEKEYQEFQKASEDATSAKEKEQKEKLARRNEVQARLVEIQDEKQDTQDELVINNGALAHNNAQCDLDWEGRKLSRAQQKHDMQDVLTQLDQISLG
eukprot:TRINITY_DN14714_c0_g3_i1.p1 TRINITY_DN14714_c0_g3~~TRINITY_DN14714_c0_g3_i1.p1  ORF type:complete len:695 (-),score=255.62 TRINITY_DN14714_c0_g3_i1:48-2132(-)